MSAVPAPDGELCATACTFRTPLHKEGLERLAVAHYGLATTTQATSFGVSPQHMARSERWHRLCPGLYRLASVPQTWSQDLMAAVLAGGPEVVVSHRASAVLWGLAGVCEALVEVTVPRNRSARVFGAAVVHRSAQLENVDIYRRDGIPVTGVTRTLIDLGTVLDIETLESAVESGLRMGQTTVGDLERRLKALGGRGRPGTAAMRVILAERLSAPPTESELETRFVQLCRRFGLPIPLRQHEVLCEGRVARCDFVFVDARVMVELDGYAFHSSRADHQDDLERQNAMQLARPDWVLLRFTAEDIFRRPGDVAAQLRKALSR